MGDGGERLHEWHEGKGPAGGVDLGSVRESDGKVVVTHRTREDLLGDNGGTFAFDGLEAAARRAKGPLRGSAWMFVRGWRWRGGVSRLARPARALIVPWR
jgi:hypothetical protein